MAVEVELRRPESDAVVDLRLTRDAATGNASLSRTLGDFLDDSGGLASRFEYRSRVVRVLQPESWSEWQSKSGSTLTVLFG